MPSIELDKDIYRQLHPYCHSSGHVTNGSVSRNGKQNAVLFSLGPSNCSVGLTCLALFVPSDLIEIGLERSFCDAQEKV